MNTEGVAIHFRETETEQGKIIVHELKAKI